MMSAPVTCINSLCFDPQPFPVGYHRVFIKLCENCLASFTRDEGSRQKYCAPCVGRMLLPMNLDDYKDALPREAVQGHSHRLPHYDNSLLPKEQRRVYTRRPAPRKIQTTHRYGNWKERLMEAFAERPRMTAQEIQDIINCPGAPWSAVNLCYNCDFPIVPVGSLPYDYRNKRGGRTPRIYALALQMPGQAEIVRSDAPVESCEVIQL